MNVTLIVAHFSMLRPVCWFTSVSNKQFCSIFSPLTRTQLLFGPNKNVFNSFFILLPEFTADEQ